MAFWGIEIKPGKPFTHPPDKGRLHVSQATLGIGSASKKSLVQCNVGNRSPVFLCSLFPETAESCQLNLEFEEVDEVVFSVVGPRSVHLTGYYQLSGGRASLDNESESYGEDIADTETENSPNSEEDDYDDSFINDDEPEVSPPSPVASDDGILEDTPDKKKSKKGNKRLRRKLQVSESENDGTPQKQILGLTNHAFENLDTESEDDLPLSSLYMANSVPNGLAEVPEKNRVKETDKAIIDKTEKKGSSLFLSEETDAVADVQHKSDGNLEPKPLLPPTEVVEPVDGPKPKKRKLRGKDKTLTENDVKEDRGSTKGLKFDGSTEDLPVNEDKTEMCENKCVDGSQSGEKRKKKKRRKDKQNGDDTKLDLPAVSIDTEKSISGVGGNNIKDLSTRITTLSNGLILEEVEMGQEEGKIAARGKKVNFSYICKSKKSGEVLDSNVEKIRLGKKEVEGVWDVGLDGMRVGGKRRLIVPPWLRSQVVKVAHNIGADSSWLVFDVELVKVK